MSDKLSAALHGSVPMTNPDAVVLRDLTDPVVQADIRAQAQDIVSRSRERRLRQCLRAAGFYDARAKLDEIAELTERTGGYDGDVF